MEKKQLTMEESKQYNLIKVKPQSAQNGRYAQEVKI